MACRYERAAVLFSTMHESNSSSSWLTQQALSPKLWYVCMGVLFIIFLVYALLSKDGQYFSRGGGMITIYALILMNRATIRGTDSSSVSPAEQAIDSEAVKMGLLISCFGTFIWAVGDMAINIIGHWFLRW